LLLSEIAESEFRTSLIPFHPIDDTRGPGSFYAHPL
jgi:hypothetical protein